jgi:hypothetical protein
MRQACRPKNLKKSVKKNSRKNECETQNWHEAGMPTKKLEKVGQKKSHGKMSAKHKIGMR